MNAKYFDVIVIGAGSVLKEDEISPPFFLEYYE